jgi:hypothetical protein
MAVKKTPDWLLKATPRDIQYIYHTWRDAFIQYYDVPMVKGFNPNDYDIECARMDGHNSSYVITKWGYAINFTMYDVKDSSGDTQWGKNDGVFYPRLGNGIIIMNGMTKSTKGKNKWDYKELCNRYLRSSYNVLADEAYKKTHPFTNFI